jgi:prolyl oligopeptidase
MVTYSKTSMALARRRCAVFGGRLNAAFASRLCLFFAGQVLALGGWAQSANHYPQTRTVTQADTFYGVRVEDPYRWFENDTTVEVKQWVRDENKVTSDYLAAIPYRDSLRKRLTALFNISTYSAPRHVGDYYLYTANTGLQPQNVVYRKKGAEGAAEVFIDPNTLSADHTTRVSLGDYSEDKKYIIVDMSVAGSDLQDPVVYEVATGKPLPDKLVGVKVSGFAWKGNGFYYSRYPIGQKGKELTQLDQGHMVCYHVLGTDQSADRTIFTIKDKPLSFNTASITEDRRFLIVQSYYGKNITDLYYRDFQSTDTTLRLLIKGEPNLDEGIVDDSAGLLLVQTKRNAPNSKIVLVDPQHPDTGRWKLLIPEQDAPLTEVYTAYGKLYLVYLRDVLSRVYQYNYSGRMEKEIKLPDLGTAFVAPGLKDDPDFYFGFTSFLYPVTIFKYNIPTGKSEVYYHLGTKIRPEDYETKQVFYPSKDGTKIPLFIVYKKGLVKDGKRPTLLTAYGGYGINILPAFNPSTFPLLDAGGVYALANIRGGGEYGESWHQAGMLLKTQNRFDDFIGAAEWLIREQYTSPGKLGIIGGSHGGCLTASTMLQRPDLFHVVITQAGVQDMLRFQKFTVGWNWMSEYGNPDSAADFRNLYAYSPAHNVKTGVAYPAVLVTTADHDDRVVPMHSFKLTAQLQSKQSGPNAVLLRVDTNSAHGSSSKTKYIESMADILAFFFWNTGVMLAN